ncbi:type II restriction endonuclease [Thermococcus sp.]|uniref:type II restriction endonuclease n=1 Tax=Thermococcus sp. TaxID=35749 RepID=UPI00263416F8|nr:type II restriction endonuclease [Thermococcus sp.]
MTKTLKIDTRKKPTENIPSTSKIIEEAITELKIDALLDKLFEKDESGEGITPSRIAKMLEEKAFDIYKEYENQVRKAYLSVGYSREKLEQSFQQARFSRGGKTFEIIFTKLLNRFRIKYDRNKVIKIYDHITEGEKPDFIIPSARAFLNDPSSSILITVKRKVRERWREAVGEAQILRNKFGNEINFWFVGFDEEFTIYSAIAMLDNGIDRIYVINGRYDSLIEEIRRISYSNFDNDRYLLKIRRFSDIFDDIIQFMNEHNGKQLTKQLTLV